MVYALPVLPTLFPLAVLLLEPEGARLRVAPFVVLGALVSGWLLTGLLRGPVQVTEHPHALEYLTSESHGDVASVFYVIAVIGPSLLSGYRSIVAFGVLNLIGLAAVAAPYVQAFTSVWCVYPATTSLLVLLHMYRRRHPPTRTASVDCGCHRTTRHGSPRPQGLGSTGVLKKHASWLSGGPTAA